MPAGDRKNVYRYRKFEFWAAGGRVYIADTTKAGDEAYDLRERLRTIAPAELMQRAVAIAIAAKDDYANVRSEVKQLMEDAAACAKEAKKQGDPTDPKVREDMTKHRRKSSIIMPQDFTSGGMGSPMGLKYKIEKERAESVFLDGPKLVPDLSLG